MAKDWRTERRLGKLEALLAVADRETSLIISGTGDVIEPEDGIIAIGSGGPYALSAARALVGHTTLDATTIVTESLVPRKLVAKKPGDVPGMVLRIAAGVRPVGSASSMSRV